MNVMNIKCWNNTMFQPGTMHKFPALSVCLYSKYWMWDFGPMQFHNGRGFTTHQDNRICCFQVISERLYLQAQQTWMPSQSRNYNWETENWSVSVRKHIWCNGCRIFINGKLVQINVIIIALFTVNLSCMYEIPYCKIKNQFSEKLLCIHFVEVELTL